MSGTPLQTPNGAPREHSIVQRIYNGAQTQGSLPEYLSNEDTPAVVVSKQTIDSSPQSLPLLSPIPARLSCAHEPYYLPIANDARATINYTPINLETHRTTIVGKQSDTTNGSRKSSEGKRSFQDPPLLPEDVFLSQHSPYTSHEPVSAHKYIVPPTSLTSPTIAPLPTTTSWSADTSFPLTRTPSSKDKLSTPAFLGRIVTQTLHKSRQFLKRGRKFINRQPVSIERNPYERFERYIKLEVPLKDGTFTFINVVAMIDYHSPVNVISRQLLDRFSDMKVDSTERRHYADTLGGRAYSVAHVTAKWHCNTPDLFDPIFDEAEFQISEHRYRFEVIIGRPAIMKHSLFNDQGEKPMAAPSGLRTQHPPYDRTYS
jgi:hypothetical protein